MRNVFVILYLSNFIIISINIFDKYNSKYKTDKEI